MGAFSREMVPPYISARSRTIDKPRPEPGAYSLHHFAAAAVADGVDYSYFQYMVQSSNDPAYAGSNDLTNGAPPFGKGLLKWLKVSPALR